MGKSFSGATVREQLQDGSFEGEIEIVPMRNRRSLHYAPSELRSG